MPPRNPSPSKHSGSQPQLGERRAARQRFQKYRTKGQQVVGRVNPDGTIQCMVLEPESDREDPPVNVSPRKKRKQTAQVSRSLDDFQLSMEALDLGREDQPPESQYFGITADKA